MRLDGQPGLVADGLLHREAQDGFGRVAVVGGIALVGELAAQAGQVVVGHQRGHGVCNQPQQSIAGATGARGGGCVGDILHGQALMGFVIADRPDSKAWGNSPCKFAARVGGLRWVFLSPWGIARRTKDRKGAGVPCRSSEVFPQRWPCWRAQRGAVC